jgi:hypothetical protein
MDTEKLMRQEVKKYIDIADVKVLKMMHAMLEVNAENDWWDSMPNSIKKDVETALLQSKKGQVTPHQEVKKRYQKWIAK